jgi:hypothetical protein
MDYQLDARSFAGSGLAPVITERVNLGAGLTCDDPAWRSHLAKAIWPKKAETFEFGAGSIRTAFEGAVPFSVKSVRCPFNAQQLLPFNYGFV